jgi:DNA-directed RNA polymerase specialized sigma24 family protein
MDIDTMSNERRRELWLMVFRIARSLTRSNERAEDLTQQVFERLEKTSPYVPGGEITLEAHVGGILKSVYSNEAASDTKRRDREQRYVAEQAALSENVASPEEAMLAEEPSAERGHAARLVEKLGIKLAGRQPDVAVCDLMADDTTKPAHIAKALGCTPDEVREALKRIRRYMKNIVAAERGEDEEVM